MTKTKQLKEFYKAYRKASPELLEALKFIHNSPCAQERLYRSGNQNAPCVACNVIAKADGKGE